MPRGPKVPLKTTSAPRAFIKAPRTPGAFTGFWGPEALKDPQGPGAFEGPEGPSGL